MYKNKTSDNRCNISGVNIRRIRKAMPEKTSQRMLAYLMQLRGVDLDKNAIQRIEAGKRFVTDIELKQLAAVLKVTVDELLETSSDYDS